MKKDKISAEEIMQSHFDKDNILQSTKKCIELALNSNATNSSLLKRINHLDNLCSEWNQLWKETEKEVDRLNSKVDSDKQCCELIKRCEELEKTDKGKEERIQYFINCNVQLQSKVEALEKELSIANSKLDVAIKSNWVEKKEYDGDSCNCGINRINNGDNKCRRCNRFINR